MPIASTDWRLAWPSSRKQVWQRGCSRMFYKGSNCGSLTSEEVKYAKVCDQFFLPFCFLRPGVVKNEQGSSHFPRRVRRVRKLAEPTRFRIGSWNVGSLTGKLRELVDAAIRSV